MPGPRVKVKYETVRSIALLIAGLALGYNEAVVVAEPRVWLLLFAGGLIGLPGWSLADKKFLAPPDPPPPAPPAAQPPERST